MFRSAPKVTIMASRDGYLHHVTLISGHVTRQLRSGSTDLAVKTCGGLLDQALAGNHPALPFGDGVWLINATAANGFLIATLSRGPRETRIPILTIGVAPRSRASIALWRILHQDSFTPLATTAALPPPAPWLADRIEIGAGEYPEAMTWTGGFSRSIAWAWMERRT